MAIQIPVKTNSGAIFYVEADVEPGAATGPARDASGPDDGYDELRPRGVAQSFSVASKVLDETAFEQAVGVIRGLAEDVSAGLMVAEPRPTQVELEFSMGIGASGNVMVLKGDANASFKLKLVWNVPPG
jgi:hypothetical protein